MPSGTAPRAHRHSLQDDVRRLSSALLALSLACLVAAFTPHAVAVSRRYRPVRPLLRQIGHACSTAAATACSIFSLLAGGFISACGSLYARLRARETALLAAVEALRHELEQSESRIRSSADEISYCRSLLQQRAGMVTRPLLTRASPLPKS